jgi:hypothetical protein
MQQSQRQTRRPLSRAALAIGALLSLVGCTRPDVREGALYTTKETDGSYGIIKVLKTDDGGVHLRVYSNRFEARPTSVRESDLYMAGMDRKAGEQLGMGHAPISWRSFRTWGAEFVQVSSVAESELEGYRMWQEAEGGYF